MHFNTTTTYIICVYPTICVFTGINRKFKIKVCACVSGCVTAVAITTRILY